MEDTSEAFYCRHGDKRFSVSVEGVLSYVKALQDLGMLDVSVSCESKGSVVQGFEDSDEGASPN